jgi:ketosteroid isomerase-like protein
MGTNTSVVEDAYRAFGLGDIAAVLDLLADDVEWTSPRTLPHGGEFHGKADVGRFFQAIGENWKALPLAIEAVGEVGDGIVVGVLRADGTRTSGESLSYGAAHIFNIRGGKITSFREYVDIDKAL